MKDYKICTKTIMDTSDSHINFNEYGESDYYSNFKQNILPNWNFGKNQIDELNRLADKIRKEGKNKDFDCIIGLSGGLDSSYLAYVAKEIMNLRPLLFHVDAGWNTNQAVANIEKLVDGLNLDLFTEVINWEEMKDLQRAFFKSQISDQDLPQDIAFFSSLYKFAKENRIKHILTGGNFSTEGCKEPEAWGAYPGIDSTLINDIYKKFGNKKLKSFPIIDILTYKIYYKYIYGIEVHKPLNLIPYVKNNAEELLESKFGWKKFQHKHHESRFTRFYEDFWLKNKFGFDRRKVHFSSLILSGQMTREEALLRIKKSELDSLTTNNEFEYISDKLDFTGDELYNIFNDSNKSYKDYKNKYNMINMGANILRKFGVEKRLFR